MCWKILPNVFRLAPVKLILVCYIPFFVNGLCFLKTCDLEHSLSDMLVQKSIMPINNPIDADNGNTKTLWSHQPRQKSPPNSPLQSYNMALEKVKLSQQESNLNITKAITLERDAMKIFCHLLKEPKANPLLKIVAGRECVKLCKNYQQHDDLIEALGWLRFELPDHPNIWLHHATLLFTSGQTNDAMSSLREFQLQWPQDRRGFCLKELGARLQGCSRETSTALFQRPNLKNRPNQSDACKTGTLGIFGFMANSFRRNGSLALAEIVYDQGYQLGFYPTKWQRSSALRHQCLSLKSQPLWKIEDVSASIGLREVREHWRIIRAEAEEAFSLGVFDDEQENLVQEGLWQQLVLYENGQKVRGGCLQAPKTCQIIESFPELLSTRRGQIKFSLLQPGTWIHPHTGPTNCRLRAHIGLIVPPPTSGEVVLRIGDDRVNWQEGEFLIIDDSFEHEVYNNSTEARLILLIDIWHPGLSEEDKSSLQWEQAGADPFSSSEVDHSLISIAGLTSKIKKTIPYMVQTLFI